MTKQEYIEIETLQDIVDKVPQENIDLFLADLKSRVVLHQELKGLGGMVKSIYPNKMQWINDGKNGVNITIQIEKTSTP